MEFHIRVFGEQDTAAAIAMSHAIYPEYREGGWHAAEQFESERFTSYRYIAEGEEVLGYAAIRYLREGQGRVDLMVQPEWRRRGVGERLMNRLLEDLRSASAAAAHARVREDHLEAFSFLRNRGFREHQRMYGLRLSVAEAQLEGFEAIVNRLRTEGIQISTLARERECDPGCLRKLLDLHNAVLPTWPDPEAVPFQPAGYEDFARRVGHEAGDRPGALFIAKMEQVYVGYAGMFALGTAVHPKFRGRGIATALKAQTIKYAQEMRMASASTCTANPAMLAINEKLGYRRQLVEIIMMKVLRLDERG